VRVADVVAELRAFAADLTGMCHTKTPNSSIPQLFWGRSLRTDLEQVRRSRWEGSGLLTEALIIAESETYAQM
jgi:hypothetical protein